MSGFASLWGVSFLCNVDNLSPSVAAFVSSLMWIGLAIASPILGYLSTRLGNRKMPLVFSALLGVVVFTLVLLFKLPTIYIAILIFLAGAACSGQALTFTLVKENNNHNVVASAISLNNMAVVISGAIFQPLIGWLLRELNFLHAIRYRYALLVILAAYVICFFIAWCFIKDPLRQRTTYRHQTTG